MALLSNAPAEIAEKAIFCYDSGMQKPIHYMRQKMVKMGKWYLQPLDSETWHGQWGNYYFKKHFGYPKTSLNMQDLKTNWQHVFFPLAYIQGLFKRIDRINKTNYKNLEKKLLQFYPLEHKGKIAVKKNFPDNLAKVSNTELANLFVRTRDWIHRITIFDQFGWIAEEYWTPKMDNILVNKLKIRKGSEEYNRVLFVLSKPERISTTLSEKLAAFEQAIAIKKRKQTLVQAAQNLARDFGWMPIFTFGKAWLSERYKKELGDLVRADLAKLQTDASLLRKYSQIRNKELSAAVKKYKINNKDLQVFLEFGLSLDTRNEAEYFVSYAGFYLMKIYAEMAKRLHLNLKQLRNLLEGEIIKCLQGKTDPHKILKTRKGIMGWGFDEKMEKQIYFFGREAKELFAYLERNPLAQRIVEEAHKGVCASPGRVVGVARIVHSPLENDKVKKGDVLITHATTVDYLPSMKKAVAIVTEVGGLTCHAAVVSREFGIPCIVSLKDAMQKFKDGEKIEVNADQGLVINL